MKRKLVGMDMNPIKKVVQGFEKERLRTGQLGT